MLVKHALLLATLMLGASTAIPYAGGLSSPPTAPAALFGAPQAPADKGFAASVVGSRAANASPDRPAKPMPSGPWTFNRPNAATPAPDADAPEAGPATVDLSALRYYARENDLARVAAEIRLLRAKHPGWEPPEDLFNEAKGGESEQPFWDLFAKHDFAGLHAAMDERRQRVPGWQPTNDLASKLALAESYDTLVKASDAKDWNGVIDTAAANRGLMTCANVDALWRTAEAFVGLNDEAQAVEAYRYVLATCNKPGERVATVQKASALLKSPEAVEGLVELGKRRAVGGEYDGMRLDRLRQAVGNAAAGKTDALPSQADLDQLAASAKGANGTKDAELLGWYAFKRKDFAGAETWFRLSLQSGPNPKGAEGLVLALRDGGKLPEASALALQYADLDPLNRKLMVEVVSAGLASPTATPLPAETMTRLAAAIDAEKSADGAQAFGWSRYKAADLAGADAWFRKSADWQQNESAAIGLVVTAKRLKHQADYVALMERYRGLYPRVAELESVLKSSDRPAPGPRRVARAGKNRSVASSRAPGGQWDAGATAIVKTFEGGNYDRAMAMLDERKAAGRAEPAGLSVVRGWALYKKGDWDDAKQIFTSVGGKGLTRESREGIRVIDMGYTNPRFR